MKVLIEMSMHLFLLHYGIPFAQMCHDLLPVEIVLVCGSFHLLLPKHSSRISSFVTVSFSYKNDMKFLTVCISNSTRYSRI